MELLKRGAEANLYLAQWHGRKVIIKRRLPKRYRIAELDAMIRGHRTIQEPNIMHTAKEAGVSTPTIFMVDMDESNIVMEFVEGKQVKEILDKMSSEERLSLSVIVGRMIGRLHRNGIIHGDLTTSNMILQSYGKVVFVDFGLSERSVEVEPKGVDLHLMKRALNSTHHKHAKACFEAVMEGYSESVGRKEASKVALKIREIEKRGRYVANRDM